MTESYYGFKIKKQYVTDLAENKNIFRFKGEGYFKSEITIYDKDDNDIIKIKKRSSFSFSWEISKKEEKIADFRGRGIACGKHFNIETKDGNYTVTRHRLRRYTFNDNLGKEVALLKTEGTYSLTNLLEIKENFDPLIALSVSIIFVYLIRKGKQYNI